MRTRVNTYRSSNETFACPAGGEASLEEELPDDTSITSLEDGFGGIVFNSAADQNVMGMRLW